MMSEDDIHSVLKFRNSKPFDICFIKEFDREWDNVVKQLKHSEADLKSIQIMPKPQFD